jgi:hypothetical protein
MLGLLFIKGYYKPKTNIDALWYVGMKKNYGAVGGASVFCKPSARSAASEAVSCEAVPSATPEK